MRFEIKKLHHNEESPLEVCSVRDFARVRAGKLSKNYGIWLVVWECGQLKSERRIVSFAKEGKIHWATPCSKCNQTGSITVYYTPQKCDDCVGLGALISHDHVEAA